MVLHDARQRMHAYLAQKIEDRSQLALHMLLLDPFFSHAENERYALASREQLGVHLDDLAHAIRIATDGACVSASMVTIGDPRTFAICRAAAWKKRIGRLECTFRTQFELAANRSWHGRDGYGEFMNAFKTVVWRDSLEDAFHFRPKELNALAADTVRGILLAYLSYAVQGSVVGTRQMSPLVSLLPAAIPIGEPAELPGACLFLVA